MWVTSESASMEETADMCSNGAVHVFIGAPTLAQSLPSRGDGYSSGWQECRYVCTGQCVQLQGIGSGNIQDDSMRVGDAQTRTLPSTKPPPSEGGPELAKPQSPAVGTRENSDGDVRFTRGISDLIAVTEHCHIALHAQRPADDVRFNGGLPKGQTLQNSTSESSNDNGACSVEAEFLTVWACSQIAVKGHVTVFEHDLCVAQRRTQSCNPQQEGDAEFPTEEKAALELALERAEEECSSSSLELFTQTSDDGSNEQSSLFQQVETCTLNLKDTEKSSSTCVPEPKNDQSNCGGTSCKRKKTFACCLPSPPKYDTKCKKARPSSSPVKFLSKEFDHLSPLRTTIFTLLKHCLDTNIDYNILAVVMQPCHMKEIQVKTGPSSGTSHPLATVVVLDQSDIICKVLLWRRAAFWSLALSPGDIIMLTNLTICEDKWNEEILLQSSYKSGLLNLGNCFILISDKCSDFVECFFLQELLKYIAAKQCHLRDLPSRLPQKLDCVQHVRLSELQPELLIHSVLKVAKIAIRKECTYRFRGLQQNKVILTVVEVEGQCSTLILWGASVSWCNQISHKKNHIWLFKYLLCKKNMISGDLELHTTPWSSCECLFDDDKRAIDFQNNYFENLPPPPKVLSLRTIIEDRYSGVTETKASISKLEFYMSGHQSVHMTQKTSIRNILMSLPSVIYSGCGKCKKELKIDSNNLYEQCFACLPFNQVRTFYKPAIMTVSSEDSRICVHVSSDILESIFLKISPSLLHRLVADSAVVTYGAIVADLCHSLLAETGELYLLTIRSQFSLDENSIPIEEEFHLLHFHADI